MQVSLSLALPFLVNDIHELPVKAVIGARTANGGFVRIASSWSKILDGDYFWKLKLLLIDIRHHNEKSR